MSSSFILALTVVFLVAGTIGKEDFAIIGGYNTLHTRPMSSNELTQLTGLGSLDPLYDVDYDPASDQIYWASSTEIGRCKSDGSSRQIVMQNPRHNDRICSGFYSIQINFDTSYIFWVTKCGSPSENVLQRANLDGTSVTTLGQKANGEYDWTEISLDKSTGDIYWSVYSRGDIYRVTPSGTNTTVIDRGWTNGQSVVFDPPGTLYWIQLSPESIILRADTDGQNVETFYSQAGYTVQDQLNMYKDELYFIQAGDPAGRRIFHMKKDGSQPTPTKDTTVDFVPHCLHLHEESVPGPSTQSTEANEKTTPVMIPGKQTTPGRTTDQRTTLTKTTSSAVEEANSKGIPLGAFEFALIGLSVFVIALVIVIFILVRRRVEKSDETREVASKVVEMGDPENSQVITYDSPYATVPDQNDDAMYATVPDEFGDITGNGRPVSCTSAKSNSVYEQPLRHNNTQESVVVDFRGGNGVKEHQYDTPPDEALGPAAQHVEYANTTVKSMHLKDIATPDVPSKNHVHQSSQHDIHVVEDTQRSSEDIALKEVVQDNRENKTADKPGLVRLDSGELDDHHLWHALTADEDTCVSLEFVRDNDDDDDS